MSKQLKPIKLCLESLESRECPAVWSYLADAGRTLILNGDDAADRVSIVDERGTLTVTGSDGRPSASYRSSKIDTVAVNLRGGDDRFEYKTVGEVTSSKQLRVDLGNGDDTGIIRWADDGSTSRANLTSVIYGGAGNDALGTRVGQLAPGATVAIRAYGGAGDDAVQVQSLAPGRGSTLDVALRGGDGSDLVGFSSTGEMGANARADFDLLGEAGDDVVSAEVAGRVAGRFDVRVDGGAGSDQVSLTSLQATGPNKIRAVLVGGTEDDQLATLSDSRTASILVDGGGGNDLGLLVNGVERRSIEQSQAPTNYELKPGPAESFYPVLPTSTLQQSGRIIEYWTAGKSAPGEPVVVLLTGFGGTIDTWQSVPGQLARGVQVIAINRPGYGKTSPTHGDYGAATVEDIRAVVQTVAAGRPVVLVGHSLGGLYANLFARLHPDEVAGVVFVDATAPEVVVRADQFGAPNGGLGDASNPIFRLQPIGVTQEVLSVVQTANEIVGGAAFPAIPVVSLRAGPADLLADDPEGDAFYQALGSLGQPGETRRVQESGHNIQFDRPGTVVKAVTDVVKLSTKIESCTTLSANIGSGVAGDPVVLTARVQGGNVVSGVVTFKAGETVLGTAPVVNGRAILTTTDLQVGANRVVADFGGSPRLTPSRDAIRVRLAEPSADSKFISRVLAEVGQNYAIPGLTAAVVVGNRVIAGGAGVRQSGGEDPVQIGDRFANGSTTKAMTATLAGVLVEKGLIRWDSTVAEVFPELKGKIQPQLEKATLEQFFRHRSGLINGNQQDSSPALLEKALSLAGEQPSVARQEILLTLLKEPLAVAPGDFLYSNAGYAVAGAMLERVTGTAYEQLMSQYLFTPLGMTSATFDSLADLNARTPLGTDPFTGTPVTFDSEAFQQADLALLNPAGAGLRMNVADWAKFVRVQLGQEVNGIRLLKPETIARIQTADPGLLSPDFADFAPGYASGWGVRPADWNGRDPKLGASIGHDGSDTFWLAEVEAYPSANFAVLLMSNTLVGQTEAGFVDLEATAFAEIKQILTDHFAPRKMV